MPSQDLGMSRSKALGAITMLAASAFAGILTGGVVGEKLHGPLWEITKTNKTQ